jgi:hypothetical protein
VGESANDAENVFMIMELGLDRLFRMLLYATAHTSQLTHAPQLIQYFHVRLWYESQQQASPQLESAKAL